MSDKEGGAGNTDVFSSRLTQYGAKKAVANVRFLSRISINYVKRYSKTSGNIGAQGVMLYTAYECMYKVQKYFCQTDGKKVQHFILSFDARDDVESVNLMNLGYAVCALFPEYQLIFGIHDDTEHIHIHWALNPVNMITGSKISFTFKETYTLRTIISELLNPYNILCNLRVDKPKAGTILEGRNYINSGMDIIAGLCKKIMKILEHSKTL